MNEELKEFIIENKDFVEKFQWSVMNSVASLIYCAYLSKMKKVEKPVPHINVVPIRQVVGILDPDGPLGVVIKLNALYNFRASIYSPEMDDKFCEKMKEVLSSYILHNVQRRIPETIMVKFGLNTDQQLFREDRELSLFDPLNTLDLCDYTSYLSNQISMQYFMLTAGAENTVDVKETEFFLENADIVVLNNENAICPICFNLLSSNKNDINELVFRVTSFSMEEINLYKYKCTTSEHNQIKIISVKGKELQSNAEKPS